MKIYGNSNADGFGIYMGLITALFVAGGIGLAKVGGIVLLAGLPVFAILVGLMAMKLSKWDVMSDLDDVKKLAEKVEAKTVARAEKASEKAVEKKSEVVRFPVAAQTDAKPEQPKVPLFGNQPMSAALPNVEKPKSAVETNTHVA